MSEREIVQFIKDNGYNCYHTRRECHACPFGSNSIVKTCGCCLNKPATHDAHLKRIKLVDEYLAQFSAKEHTLAVIKDMCDAFNKYHEKKELEFIAEIYRIDSELKYKDKFAELKEAHKNGASIEFLHDLIGQWRDVKEPSWIDDTEYRIKPEPKYRPYTKPNYDLCGTVIKDKEKNNNHYVISVVSDDNRYFFLGSFGTANQLFSKYVTKDGKPLGEEIK